MIRWGMPWIAVALVVGGCEGPSDGANDGTESDLTHAKSGCAVYEAELSPRIEAGKEQIANYATPYGAIVLDALRENTAVVRPFCMLERDEFTEVKKSVVLEDFPGTDDEQYEALRAGEVRAMRSVERALYGFQWGKHIYLSSRMKTDDVVGTLGHEVKHVLRHAEHRNYNDQRVACIEEFEAYKAEILVKRSEVTDDEISEINVKLRELFDLSKLANDNCGYK